MLLVTPGFFYSDKSKCLAVDCSINTSVSGRSNICWVSIVAKPAPWMAKEHAKQLWVEVIEKNKSGDWFKTISESLSIPGSTVKSITHNSTIRLFTQELCVRLFLGRAYSSNFLEAAWVTWQLLRDTKKASKWTLSWGCFVKLYLQG